jgi:hypothetical protein
MTNSKWSVITASACISRNGGKVGAASVHAKNPGLKVLGAIDYLCNYCGFVWVRQA